MNKRTITINGEIFTGITYNHGGIRPVWFLCDGVLRNEMPTRFNIYWQDVISDDEIIGTFDRVERGL